MVSRRKNDWDKILKEWDGYQGSVKDFCSLHGFNPSSLYKNLRIRKVAEAKAKTIPELVKIEPILKLNSPSPGSFQIGKIDSPSGFSFQGVGGLSREDLLFLLKNL